MRKCRSEKCPCIPIIVNSIYFFSLTKNTYRPLPGTDCSAARICRCSSGSTVSPYQALAYRTAHTALHCIQRSIPEDTTQTRQPRTCPPVHARFSTTLTPVCPLATHHRLQTHPRQNVPLMDQPIQHFRRRFDNRYIRDFRCIFICPQPPDQTSKTRQFSLYAHLAQRRAPSPLPLSRMAPSCSVPSS
jgi:hypothetical protein